MFLFNPTKPVRLTALSLNTSRNTPSVKSTQSLWVMSKSLGCGANLGSVVDLIENGTFTFGT